MDLPRRPVRVRPSLTERELQVLRGMADGKSNAEIGRELFVSEDTVKTHARRLFRKLGARDRAHAVASGFRAGPGRLSRLASRIAASRLDSTRLISRRPSSWSAQLSSSPIVSCTPSA